MKVKLLTDGEYIGLESAIGKIFDAVPIKEDNKTLCCEILGLDLKKHIPEDDKIGFVSDYYYYFLPEEFEVVEE